MNRVCLALKFIIKGTIFLFLLLTSRFFYGRVPLAHSYEVYISQLYIVRFARVCTKDSGSNDRNLHITFCSRDTDITSLSKIYNLYKELIQKYAVNVEFSYDKGYRIQHSMETLHIKYMNWKWSIKSYCSIKKKLIYNGNKFDIVEKTLKLVFLGRDINKLIAFLNKY